MADPLSVVGSVVGIVQLGLVVSKGLSDYYASVKKSRSDVIAMFDSIEALTKMLTQIEQTISRSSVDSKMAAAVWGNIYACEAGIECLQKKLVKIKGVTAERGFQSLPRRLQYPFKESTLAKLKEVINDDLMPNLALAISALHLDMSITSQHAVVGGFVATNSNINSFRSDHERDKILRWLMHTDPTVNHIAARTKHQTQTGNWFLQGKEYFEWRDMPCSFLWLHGIPGCGKTVLCSTIIETTSAYCTTDPGSALAYFYFSFSDTEKQKTRSLLLSLLGQLVCHKPKIPSSLLNLYNSYRNGKPSTDGLKATIRSILTENGQSFIIIDALDECPSDNGERNALIALLTEFSMWSLPNLHILVTSRKEPDIDEALTPLLTIRPICIQSGQVDSDIRLHIRTQLATDPKLKKWSLQIREDIETSLVNGADGMFRWVSCQLDSLKQCLKPSTIRKALASLPKTLDDTYTRILLNINEEYRREALTALQWLVFSKRPLRLEELAEAAVVNPETEPPFNPEERFPDPHNLLQILSGLVVVSIRGRSSDMEGWIEPEVVEEVKLAHFSVQEYLTSDRIRFTDTSFFKIVDAIAQQTIAENCLLYILTYSQAEHKSLSEQDLEDFPLLQYASRFWYNHAAAAPNMAETLLYSLVFRLLVSEEGFSSWTRVHHPDESWKTPFSVMDEDGGSPIYFASYIGLYDAVQLLLKMGADANAQGGEFGHPLHAAAREGHSQIVQRLLDEGADVNALETDNGSALHGAAYCGHDKIVLQLLQNGADINLQGGFFGSALQAASDRGLDLVVHQLLENGAKVNAQGGYYGNALQAASYFGHDQVVQKLLQNGANVNAEGGEYSNALQAASYRGCDKIVQQLLEKGADVNIKGGYYGSALQAATYKGYDQIVKKLLEEGADVNIGGGYYGNALQAASVLGHDHIVEQLLEKGADVNSNGGYYSNPLQAASVSGNDLTVQRLLDSGADINAQGGEYGTALQAASVLGHDHIVRYLLDRGADANARGGEYGSALQAAAYWGYEGIVQRLLASGADASAQGGQYGSAVQIAENRGYEGIARRLLASGADVGAQGGDVPV